MISVTGIDNLGIQVLGVDGVTPFSFDAGHPAVLGNVAKGGNTLSLKAQLLEIHTAAPNLGEFTAGVTFTVIYP